jgi:hypothetical protein
MSRRNVIFSWEKVEGRWEIVKGAWKILFCLGKCQKELLTKN